MLSLLQPFRYGISANLLYLTDLVDRMDLFTLQSGMSAPA